VDMSNWVAQRNIRLKAKKVLFHVVITGLKLRNNHWLISSMYAIIG
jgi:hypothetical protein